MARQAQNAFQQLDPKAVHHAHHDNQGGDAQRDADQREQRDHRNEALLPLGAQIAGGDHPFEGREDARVFKSVIWGILGG
ncbi:MAG TPA: hypothetical protein VNY75_09535 [Rhizomicrobium sp.]|nr:hypothetical protein [Rhizomicrobium sp.]